MHKSKKLRFIRITSKKSKVKKCIRFLSSKFTAIFDQGYLRIHRLLAGWDKTCGIHRIEEVAFLAPSWVAAGAP
jgi:hypothetical protein